jgi:N-methylhydantoinase B/oxoprolinase/acetone carboxylase alpha subunit
MASDRNSRIIEKFHANEGLVSVGDGETFVIPVEVCEQRYGIRVERFTLDIVEAGAGRRRGGRGLAREYRMSSDGSLTVGFGRHRYPPWAWTAATTVRPTTSR